MFKLFTILAKELSFNEFKVLFCLQSSAKDVKEFFKFKMHICYKK